MKKIVLIVSVVLAIVAIGIMVSSFDLTEAASYKVLVANGGSLDTTYFNWVRDSMLHKYQYLSLMLFLLACIGLVKTVEFKGKA